METRDAFMERLSQMFRGSNLPIYTLPKETEEYDLEGVDCPACPINSHPNKLKRDSHRSGYYCFSPLPPSAGLMVHGPHTFFSDPPSPLWWPFIAGNKSSAKSPANPDKAVSYHAHTTRQLEDRRIGIEDALDANLQRATRRPERDSVRNEGPSPLVAVDDEEISTENERSPSYSSDLQELWEVEIMYWPSKPAGNYLAWPPRVTRRPYKAAANERCFADLTFNGNLDLQRAVYGTERDWNFTSYYDMARSAWITDMTNPDWVPLFKDRPLLLRHFTGAQADSGWPRVIERGFKFEAYEAPPHFFHLFTK
ncbi:hypothetical protein PIIN_09381 [Serendipita indica DSM 11827]|uniref:Uncharacterized protein n=1 Tax=Serendipita indica (strain DSM 11827) TaxID=1109443 RepID=G4TVQ5_SERID|nr:hypothetical protein PIIN_09381 [Serendipita indica DSM 11827]